MLIDIAGPGVFLATEVVKQGGGPGLSFVSLDIDGRNVVKMSFDAARNWVLTEHNPYGVHYLSSAAGLENLTSGWPTPLVFTRSLKVSVVVSHDGVVQLLANVVVGAPQPPKATGASSTGRPSSTLQSFFPVRVIPPAPKPARRRPAACVPAARQSPRDRRFTELAGGCIRLPDGTLLRRSSGS